MYDITKEGEWANTKLKTSSGRKKGKRPNTTLKRLLMFLLPSFCLRFLYSTSTEFIASRFFLGAGVGGFMGIGVFYLLVYSTALYEELKIPTLYGLAVIFAIGWATSTYFRCATLIIVPNILGKEGRASLMAVMLVSVFEGPVINLEQNVEELVRSIGCSVELQINQSKLAAQVMAVPVKKILEDLVKSAKQLKKNSGQILDLFRGTESELESTEGYDTRKERAMKEENNTTLQRRLSIKTMLRCQYIIERGVDKCYDWFDKKHDECMKAIWLPLLNVLLCVPMKLKFFCNILYLGDVWCKKRLPLEGNFGQLFDKVNATLNNLDNGFFSKVVIREEEQTMFVGLNTSSLLITEEIMENINRKRVVMEKMMSVIKVLLYCTIFYLFFSAFSYCRQYNSNIRFDNLYVTTYFTQIDARRRKLNKRHLLPLQKVERNQFIFPVKPMIQGPEVMISVMELLQCIPILLFLVLSIFMDLTLFNIMQIIRKHSRISYTFSSHHRLEISVAGETLLANLLRNTIGAFNTSSSTFEIGKYNEVCLPSPIRMTFLEYLRSCLPMVALLVLCVIQVYIYRLRRVVAAFYFPQREKRRVLFLYNQTLRKRVTAANARRKQIMRKARNNRLLVRTLVGSFYRHCPWIRHIIRRRCIVCNCAETGTSYVCRTPDCGTVYCRQCWREMRRFCFACTPYEDFITDTSHSDYQHSHVDQ